MKNQLALLEERHREWRLDEQTRRAGRRGVESARAALRRSARTDDCDRDHRRDQPQRPDKAA